MIYIDNNATTPLDQRVVDAMAPYWTTSFANPSSPYTAGRAAAAALERARGQVARLIGATSPALISFTGGGTESNALALLGALEPQRGRWGVVIGAVEHACVFETAMALQGRGFHVELIPVGPDGALDLAAAQRLIGPDTAVVSLMLANNETGVIYPVAEVAAVARAAGALMHCDAVQAVGKIPVRVSDLGVDLLSLCAHKLHGPKGVGALYARDGAPFVSPIRGGDQEYGRRAGTENVPGIVGFGVAAEESDLDSAAQLAAARDRFERDVLAAVPDVEVIGQNQPRLPNTSLLQIRGVESEALIARLDLAGFCVSSGSACASGAAEPSRVLRAMGRARAGWGTLRISTSRRTEASALDSLVATLVPIVLGLRQI